MLVEKSFVFSFGGAEDFGEIFKLKGKKFTLDFSPRPVGIGFAIRAGVDVEDLSFASKINLIIKSENPINANVEFKTIASGGSPEDVEKVTICGDNEIIVEIPKLMSPLKEIVIFFPRNGREDGIKLDFEKIELI